jgi:hypothetical protein
MNSGIYCIENSITGKIYVGQSKQLSRRMNGKHKNCKYLEHAISKYYGVQRNMTKGYIYWRVYLYHGKKPVRLGNHKLEKDAAKEYNKYVIDNELSLPLNIIEGEDSYV